MFTVAGPNVSFAKLAASQPDFPNAKLLVSAASVQETAGTKNFVIIDARSAGYDISHIPGAINIKFGDYFTSGSGLLPVTELNNKLSAAGLKRNMTFVIYDNTTDSFGAAGRIFWTLEYLGCNKVYILDGGWDKWVADGRPTETAINTLPAAKFKASIKKSKRMTKEIIQKKLGTKNFAVVDSRTDEEYNGWQLYGEARGGHITGAIQIPYAWFFNADKTVLNYSDLKTMFESRGITRKMQVTAYCTVGIRSGFVYFLYRLMGYNKASNYDGSIAEWAADPSLPMEKMANYQQLVYPGWVKDLIDGNDPLNPPKDKYVIAAVGWEYTDLDTAIPGSIYINTDEVESFTSDPYPGGNLWPDPQLQANIEKMGISKDTTVILYTRYTDYTDPIAAARVLWALMYAGVEDVRMLNGGLPEWIAAGYPVTSISHIRTGISPVDFGAVVPVHPEYLATTDYVQKVVNNDPSVMPAVLADIRSWDEYIGAKDDYSYIDTLGRIPGAKWGHWGPSTYVGGDFRDAADGTFRSYTEVAQMWKDWGITSDSTVSYYCGTAWRSSLGFFYGYLMGWPNIKNYDGSWMEWSMGPGSETRPIATGTP